jgi:hypothetical protein
MRGLLREVSPPQSKPYTRRQGLGKIDCRTSGRHGFAIRILPGTADLAMPFEPGLLIWN